MKTEMDEFEKSQKIMSVNARMEVYPEGIGVTLKVNANRDGLFALINAMFKSMEEKYDEDVWMDFMAQKMMNDTIGKGKIK